MPSPSQFCWRSPAGIPRQARKNTGAGAAAEQKDDSANGRLLRCVGKRALEEQWSLEAVAGSQQIEGAVGNGCVDVVVDGSAGSRWRKVDCEKSSVDSYPDLKFEGEIFMHL